MTLAVSGRARGLVAQVRAAGAAPSPPVSTYVWDTESYVGRSNA